MDIIFDTCVWFNLIQNIKFYPIADEIIEFLDQNKVTFLFPEVIIVEFKRNKERLISVEKDNYKSKIKSASQLSMFLDPLQTTDYKSILNRISKNIEQQDVKIDSIVSTIERIIQHRNAVHLSISNEAKLNAVNRALEKKWPFKNNKNCMGDALIFECLIEHFHNHPSEKIYFVSSDKSDFSQKDNPRLVHEEIKQQFESLNFEYFINPGDVLNKIKANTISKQLIEDYDLWEKMGNLVIHWGDFDNCNFCGGDLERNGYRVICGTAGSYYVCSKCGKEHLAVDYNY